MKLINTLLCFTLLTASGQLFCSTQPQPQPNRNDRAVRFFDRYIKCTDYVCPIVPIIIVATSIAIQSIANHHCPPMAYTNNPDQPSQCAHWLYPTVNPPSMTQHMHSVFYPFENPCDRLDRLEKMQQPYFENSGASLAAKYLNKPGYQQGQETLRKRFANNAAEIAKQRKESGCKEDKKRNNLY